MKKRRQTIIFSVFILVLVGVFIWFFYFLNREEQKGIEEQAKNLFPFGEIGKGKQGVESENQLTKEGDGQEQGSQDPEILPDLIPTAGPRLRQVSYFPTGGFVPLIRTEEKEIKDISIDASGNSSQVLREVEVEKPYVRFSSIKSGNIYETALSPSSLRQKLLVENFIPNAEKSFFSPDGDNVIFQYWNREGHFPESYLSHLKKIEMTVDACPYDFSFKLRVGDDSLKVLGLHEFLNKNPRTQIATEGVNSPGAETSRVTQATLTAIKNFQSLYELDIDGKLGPATAKKMLELCNQEMLAKAKRDFAKRTTSHTSSGSFLPQNIMSLSMRPGGGEFFYLVKNSRGMDGRIRSFKNEQEKTIFESPYSEWISRWNSDESIELSTKPSYLSPGYSYGMSTQDGDYHKSFKERNGLMTLASPDNKKILLSEIDEDGLRVSLFDRDTGIFNPLAMQTLIDKCTWSSDSKHIYCGVPNTFSYKRAYPDKWYQGFESYTDSLWSIDVESLEERFLSDFKSEFDADLDIESIALDKNSNYLYFLDKKTEFLWSYRLVNA